MRVSAEPFDTGGRLVRNREDRQGIPIPGVRYRLRILAPDGTEAYAADGSAAFPKAGSEYFVERKRGEVVFETIELYDFRGQDAHTAMANEVWERLGDSQSWSKWPRGVLKVQDKYQDLPQAGRLDPDAGG